MNDEMPAERPQKIELYRSETLLVRKVLAADSQNWVITFDHHSIGEGLDRFGFGEEFLLANGISAIHVLGCGNDWYQYDDIFDAMATVREATAGATRKITYGSSMGGYAALRLADAVAADGVLALSPQWSIDPSQAPWEDRWPQDAQRVRWIETINGAFFCRACPVIVFDPHVALDLRHVTQISAGTPSVLVPVPYSGHPASTFLGEVSLLRPLLEDVLRDHFNPKAMGEAIRERRSASSVYLGALAERQPTTRPRTALALARAARVARPESTLGMLSLARILTRIGNHDEAVALHREIAVRTERLPLYLISFADALWAAKMRTEAIAIAGEAVNGLPEVAHLRNWLSTMLWKQDLRASAIKQQKHAITLMPNNWRYRRKLYLYYIGRYGLLIRDLLGINDRII